MKTTLSRIFLFVLLFPSIAQAYTKAIYVCHGGDGTQPNVATFLTALDESDFSNANYWDTDISADGKIGPGDVVYLMADGGDFKGSNTASKLTVKQSVLLSI